MVRARGARRRQGRVEAEELGDGDANGRKGQRRPQPGQKRALWKRERVSALALLASVSPPCVNVPSAKWSRATLPLFSSSTLPYLFQKARQREASACATAAAARCVARACVSGVFGAGDMVS
jgi:hypothetical protein